MYFCGVIVHKRDMADQLPMLEDRVSKFIAAFDIELQKNKVASNQTAYKSDLKTAIFAKNILDQQSVAKTKSTHVLVLFVARAIVNVHVDFYDLGFVLIDREDGREVWKSRINADWYTKPEDLAKNVYQQLVKDGLI